MHYATLVYSTKNISNNAYVCLLKGIFVVQYCQIFGRVVLISGIRTDINVWISTLKTL